MESFVLLVLILNIIILSLIFYFFIQRKSSFYQNLNEFLAHKDNKLLKNIVDSLYLNYNGCNKKLSNEIISIAYISAILVSIPSVNKNNYSDKEFLKFILSDTKLSHSLYDNFLRLNYNVSTNYYEFMEYTLKSLR